MAMQEVAVAPLDIIPMKSLNNMDSMYYYLSQRLQTATNITDLIPFIQKLIKIDELKKNLKVLLDKEYQSTKATDSTSNNIQPTSLNTIRPLFISLFAMNGIPSDNIFTKHRI